MVIIMSDRGLPPSLPPMGFKMRKSRQTTNRLKDEVKKTYFESKVCFPEIRNWLMCSVELGMAIRSGLSLFGTLPSLSRSANQATLHKTCSAIRCCKAISPSLFQCVCQYQAQDQLQFRGIPLIYPPPYLAYPLFHSKLTVTPPPPTAKDT